jgi:hypothetical protein
MSDQTGLGAFAEGLMAGQAFKIKKQQVSQDQQLFQLSLQEGQMKVETERFKLDQAKRAVDIQNDVAKKLQLQMAKDKANPDYDPITEMAKLGVVSAETKINAGLVADGLDDMKAATGLVENQEKVKKMIFDNASTKAQHTADLLSQVTSNDPKIAQKQWQDAILAWTGEGHDVDQKAYQAMSARVADPNYRKAVIDSAYSRKEQAELDYKKAQVAKEKIAIDLDKAETKRNEAQARAENALADAREKNNGPGSADIKTKYQNDAFTDLKARYNFMVAAGRTDELKKAALGLGGEIQSLVKRDGIPEDEATARVVDRYARENPQAFRRMEVLTGQSSSKAMTDPGESKREVGLYYREVEGAPPEAVYLQKADGLHLVDE